MSAKWVGNGPVTNTGGGTGAQKGAARWSGEGFFDQKAKCKFVLSQKTELVLTL